MLSDEKITVFESDSVKWGFKMNLSRNLKENLMFVCSKSAVSVSERSYQVTQLPVSKERKDSRNGNGFLFWNFNIQLNPYFAV